MKERVSYTFTVLRYVHDVATGEFLNVGVVLHAPERRFLRAKTRSTFRRLSSCFPGVDGDAFKRSMAHIERTVEQTASRLDDLFPETGDALQFASRILPQDDSSLQWSPLGSGRTRDPVRELERLFDRMVLRYEKIISREARTDDEIWPEFSKALQRRQLLDLLQEKEIVSDLDRVTFRHAWKNGIWHCFEPVSFDLVDPDSIRGKAHRWVGQITSLQRTPEKFKVYFLIGEPRSVEAQSHFGQALRILQNSPGTVAIYTEAQAEQLSQDLALEVREHASRSND